MYNSESEEEETTKVFNFTMNPKEYRLLRVASQIMGLSIAAFVRSNAIMKARSLIDERHNAARDKLSSSSKNLGAPNVQPQS